MARVARRMLAANVTASLGVDLPPDASEAEVAAAVEVQRLSADAPIAMLSSDPDRFFGRTTKALDVTVARVGAATGETGPGLRGVCLGGGGRAKNRLQQWSRDRLDGCAHADDSPALSSQLSHAWRAAAVGLASGR